ncbi:MAG: esterase family protein [Acidobacteria bacterium]|nr:esterase family protein [Acidobacteriota bacterium]
MNREYQKWFSHRLGQEMELLVFGHSGTPLLVFPSSMGSFFEYEDRGMVGALSQQLDGGNLMLYCVNSVDAQSWYNKRLHPADRVRHHAQYQDYILNEVLPFIRQRSGATRVAVTGCSFGGYHATSFALRHPDTVSHCVSMSGAYDIKQFLDGYYDDNCYFHNPVDFLPNCSDAWYLDQYRKDVRWVFGAGEHDICLEANRSISNIFDAKNIPHWFDFWGLGAVHDWPLWQLMARKYFG